MKSGRSTGREESRPSGKQRLLRGASVVLAFLSVGCFRSSPPSSVIRELVPLFRDVASEAGLNYRWVIPGNRPLNILQTIGNGCAFLDYDGDGNLDILLVGTHPALFRGDGRGHFEEVTHQVGLDKLSGHFLGCAVGDYDNDGYPDIYLSAYHGGVLLHNESKKGEGRREKSETNSSSSFSLPSSHFFRDVTAEAGLKPQPWGTSCGWVETIPGSGRLDLYVCNYAVFGPTGVPQLCRENGVLTSCGPRTYIPIKGVFYKNDGSGHFHEATKETGLGVALGRGLGVAFADCAGSSYPTIAIANDEMPGDFLEPVIGQKPKYINRREESGVAYDLNANVHGGMGIDWGDYDNDGQPDLIVATFQNENKSLYHNQGKGEYTDMSVRTGLGPATIRNVAFGCKFFDYDNDGWLDIVLANGHVQDNIQSVDTSASYRQPCQLFHNSGSAPLRFQDVSATAGADFQRPLVGRGLAIGDYDNDGKLDILVVDSEGVPVLLHNQVPATGHWLGVRLIGTKCNRDGYGAVLTLEVAGHKFVRACQSCGSYLSASDPRVHFGLSDAKQADTLIIRWPDGTTTLLHNIPADRYLTVREDNGLQP